MKAQFQGTRQRGKIKILTINVESNGEFKRLGIIYSLFSTPTFHSIQVPNARHQRRARNLETIQVSRMKATLFALGCIALLDVASIRTFTASFASAGKP